MWPMKKKPAPAPEPVAEVSRDTSAPAATVGVRGQEIHLNLAPASKTAVLRMLARMQRLIEHQSKTWLAESQLAEARKEYETAHTMLTANGLMVPNSIQGLRKLAKEVEKGEMS